MKIKPDNEYDWVHLESPDGISKISIAWDDFKRDWKIHDWNSNTAFFLKECLKK